MHVDCFAHHLCSLFRLPSQFLFQLFFCLLTSGPLRLGSGPLSAKFSPWLKLLVTGYTTKTSQQIETYYGSVYRMLHM